MKDHGDLKEALQSVDADRFVATAKRIIRDHKGITWIVFHAAPEEAAEEVVA
ncbi:MAG: hypothetical protein H8E44_10900 [Planctomycetes bacterium]|nr:hypothetical protein [Planctomycetota bacterium]MBL7041657.1 hypothetical protein [Pirellulaceae bacterium]